MILPFFAQEFLKGNSISLDIICVYVYNIIMFLQLFNDYPIISVIAVTVAVLITAILFGCVFVKWHVRNKLDIFVRIIMSIVFIAILLVAVVFILNKTDAFKLTSVVEGADIQFVINGESVFVIPFVGVILDFLQIQAGVWFLFYSLGGSFLCLALNCVKGRTSKAIAFKKAKKDIKQKVESVEKAKTDNEKPQMQYGEFVNFNSSQTVKDTTFAETFGGESFESFHNAESHSGESLNSEGLANTFKSGEEKAAEFVFSDGHSDLNEKEAQAFKEAQAYSVGSENITAFSEGYETFSEGMFNLFDGADVSKDIDNVLTELEKEEVNNSKKIFDSLSKLVEQSAPVTKKTILDVTDTDYEPDIEEEPEIAEEPEIEEETEVAEEPNIEEETEVADEPDIEENHEIEKEPDIEEETEDEAEVFAGAAESEPINLTVETANEPTRTVEPISLESKDAKKYPDLKIRTVTINRTRDMNADIVKDEENPFKEKKSKKEIEVSAEAINKNGGKKTKGQGEKKKAALGKTVEAQPHVLPLTRKHIILNRTSAVNVFSEYLKDKQAHENDPKESLNTVILK